MYCSSLISELSPLRLEHYELCQLKKKKAFCVTQRLYSVMSIITWRDFNVCAKPSHIPFSSKKVEARTTSEPLQQGFNWLMRVMGKAPHPFPLHCAYLPGIDFSLSCCHRVWQMSFCSAHAASSHSVWSCLLGLEHEKPLSCSRLQVLLTGHTNPRFSVWKKGIRKKKNSLLFFLWQMWRCNQPSRWHSPSNGSQRAHQFYPDWNISDNCRRVLYIFCPWDESVWVK